MFTSFGRWFDKDGVVLIARVEVTVISVSRYGCLRPVGCSRGLKTSRSDGEGRISGRVCNFVVYVRVGRTVRNFVGSAIDCRSWCLCGEPALVIVLRSQLFPYQFLGPRRRSELSIVTEDKGAPREASRCPSPSRMELSTSRYGSSGVPAHDLPSYVQGESALSRKR